MSLHDLSPAWYGLLLEEARARLPGLPLEPRAAARHISPHVVALSKGLTRERPLPGARYLDQRELLAAYLLYYLPANAYKTRVLLEGALARGWLSPGATLRVTDLGCGPGTLLWGLIDALGRARAAGANAGTAAGVEKAPASEGRLPGSSSLSIRYRGIDHSPLALEVLSSLARRVRGRPELMAGLQLEVQTQRGALLEPAALPEPDQDLILAGNVLNELAGGTADGLERQGAWLEALVERLAPGGLLLVLEPALQATSGAVSRLRDRLVGVPGLEVLAPCTHRAPCPLVAGGPANQWCHQELLWHRSSLVQTIDDLTGLSKDRVAMSHLVVRRGTPVEAAPGDVHYRALSPALRGKGTVTVHLCGPEGFQEAVLLTRHEGERNEALREVRRGDEVILHGATKRGANLRLEADAEVEVRGQED